MFGNRNFMLLRDIVAHRNLILKQINAGYIVSVSSYIAKLFYHENETRPRFNHARKSIKIPRQLSAKGVELLASFRIRIRFKSSNPSSSAKDAERCVACKVAVALRGHRYSSHCRQRKEKKNLERHLRFDPLSRKRGDKETPATHPRRSGINAKKIIPRVPNEMSPSLPLPG